MSRVRCLCQLGYPAVIGRDRRVFLRLALKPDALPKRLRHLTVTGTFDPVVAGAGFEPALDGPMLDDDNERELELVLVSPSREKGVIGHTTVSFK